MNKLCRSTDAIEAQGIIDFLEANNIECQLMNNFLSGALGDIPFTDTGPEIWVSNETDLILAKQLLHQYFQTQKLNEINQDKTRLCPHCQETNPAHFATCWSCQKDI